MTSSMTIAVDLAKSVFEIAIADSEWRIPECQPHVRQSLFVFLYKTRA